MSTENRTIVEIFGIFDRGRRDGSSQDNAVVGINAGMLFEPMKIGRGQSELTKNQKEMINKTTLYYPWIDFSRIGIITKIILMKGSTK